MSARLTSGFFVAAYLRRVATEGAAAFLRRRGSEEAGAIFVKVDRLDGSAMLYGPAPQSALSEDADRSFMRLTVEGAKSTDVEERLAKELRFDPDLWIIETEDRQGRCFLDLVEP